MTPTLTWEGRGPLGKTWQLVFLSRAAPSRSRWATGLAKSSVTKETQVVSPEPYGNNGDLFRKSKVCHFKLTATKLLFDYLPPYCIVLSQ